MRFRLVRQLYIVLLGIGLIGVYLSTPRSQKKENSQISAAQSMHSLSSDNKINLPLTLRTKFILNNEKLCSGVEGLEYVVIVHSSVTHFVNRTWIRKTWGNRNVFEKALVVFLLGTTTNKTDQSNVEDEFARYGDIVQGNFNDSYNNLTHKGVLGFRWISQFCPEAPVIIKVDDDIVFNAYMFKADFLEVFKKYDYLMMGNINGNNSMKIIRDPISKWFVPESEPWFIGRNKYPKYASGLWVGMTNALVRAMYKAAFHTPFFWVDDVYLFGLLVSGVQNVTHLKFIKQFSFRGNEAFKCYANTTDYCPMMLTQHKNIPVHKCDFLWKIMGEQDEQRAMHPIANVSLLRLIP